MITEYLKPIFGFALKRCGNLQDAEDLSQEIVLKAFRSLSTRDDIEDYGKFIWTIAHNTLANYYRDSYRQFLGTSIDDMAEVISNSCDMVSDLIMSETISKLQSEIAYLSRLQRKIVIAYYYENKKQNEIAKELNIPLGTVKWHLFEAKKELKRGMETMRQSGELKFNPIRFAICGTNGSVGTKGSNSNFFQSALAQNIEYVAWKEAKTVNEIADALGVSPVYVESEAEYLEKYGFLTRHGDKYLCNILLDESTTELNQLHDEMYGKAAKIFANELYDALWKADIWESDKLIGGCAGQVSLTSGQAKDKNFFLWALIPYIAARSGEKMMDTTISFEEAATIRPDGGQNICYASVIAPAVKPPNYFENMQNWCGPCWNISNGLILWQIDSEWSAKRVSENYQDLVKRDLLLLSHWRKDPSVLSKQDYAYLTERGYVKVAGKNDEIFKAISQSVWIADSEMNQKLLAFGDTIREKHRAEFDFFKKRFMNAVLDATPKHLQKMQKYGLQYIYYNDGWFILHCLKELVNSGKLKLPTEEQKKALTTIIMPIE